MSSFEQAAVAQQCLYQARQYASGCLTQGSILVMIVGAVIAGATDLSYSLPGYIYVSVCAVSTAVYLILIRLISDKTGKLWDAKVYALHRGTRGAEGDETSHMVCAGLSPSGLQFYNNCIALPMMFSYMVLATNELREMAVLPQIRDPHFLVRGQLLPHCYEHACHKKPH